MKVTKERLGELFAQILKAVEEDADIEVTETGSYAKSVKNGSIDRTPTGSLFYSIAIHPMT
ncbi:MAG: hypothetical protein QM703_13645 [Gemmatales bacterium]